MDTAKEQSEKGDLARNRPQAPVLDLQAEEIMDPPPTADPLLPEEAPAHTAADAEAEPTRNETAARSDPGEPPEAADAAASPFGPTDPATDRNTPRRGSLLPGLLAGTLAGGAVAAAVAFYLPPRTASAPERPDLTPRLQALETRVSQVAQSAQNTAPPAGIPESRINELAARAQAGEEALLAVRALEKRIGEMETKVASLASAPPPAVLASPTPAAKADEAAIKALEARFAPLESADEASSAEIKALQATIADLRTQLQQGVSALTATQRSTVEANVTAASTATEVSTLTTRVQAMETAVPAIQQKLAAVAAPDNDAAARLATAALALRGAVERGEPYAALLAAVTELKADAALLTPLQPFAATGVPGASALAAELDALLAPRAPAPAASASTGTGILDKLQESASKLVRVRRADEAPAADSTDTVGRVRAAARRGDIATAQKEAATLQAAQAATVQPWLAKVQGRAAALDAARKLAQQSAERLTAKAAQ